MIPRSMNRVVLLSMGVLGVLGVLALAACRPKGSDKAPALEKTSVGNYVIRHPNFEGHLDPKVSRDKSKWSLTLEYSGMPEKSAITVEGKTVPLSRSGEVPTSVDLARALGDAPITTLTSSTKMPIDVPFELTFWDKRQKVSATITEANVWLELRSCLSSPPCEFTSEAPPNVTPNIVVFKRGDTMGQTIYGTPGRLRDIDWIAQVSQAPDVDGPKCRMTRMTPGAPKITDEHVLKREAERVTIFDRRTGTKLQEKDLVADDRCPPIASMKLTGEKSGLRNALTQSDRDRLFKSLRGPEPGSSVPPPLATGKPRK